MPIDWTKIYKEYKGLWVAIKDDQITVIASGKSLVEALDNSKKKGYTNPILTRMPDELVAFAGAN